MNRRTKAGLKALQYPEKKDLLPFGLTTHRNISKALLELSKEASRPSSRSLGTYEAEGC